MPTPVFEEIEPAGDCECPGCVRRTGRDRAAGAPVRGRPVALERGVPPTGRPAARGALALAAVTGTVLAAGHPAPAAAAAHGPALPGAPAGDGRAGDGGPGDDRAGDDGAGDDGDTPQGGRSPLHGPGGAQIRPVNAARAPLITRAEIIKRATTWVEAKVPYSMTKYWKDGYRQDCSGFVSMAWHLDANEWTGSLQKFGTRIGKDQLQNGDILLFHNPDDPNKGSHVTIFGGWTDETRTYYVAYEQTPPETRRKATPYAYWSNSERYVAYRYKGLSETPGGGVPAPEGPGGGTSGGDGKGAAYPGALYFGPGANNPHVTRLGRMLAARGGARFYASGPGPRWTEADRRATRAFQRAQGWRGAAADGLPGPVTWSYLAGKKGRNIPAGAGAGQGGSSHGVPGYPGRALFRPGADNAYVTRLGRQLVKKGFGRHYTRGPGPRWSEADRRNVEAFQRAQGWRGGAADGYPGPETWRRLFA
ncbi:peptidoglycan-binding protein [Streptomyces sp. NPDC059786]|uniref:peptidoglycan-binding protein n=1 Tax=Streptomyces sp. NPDC059786 TaxID=3346946 RepID=UPI00364729A2